MRVRVGRSGMRDACSTGAEYQPLPRTQQGLYERVYQTDKERDQ